MRIGELSNLVQVPAKTLRYYEEIGVLSAPTRTEQGYRDYSIESVDQIHFIKASQSVGLSLAEIREIIGYRRNGIIPCQHVLGLLKQRSKEYEERAKALIDAKNTIDALITRAETLTVQDCLEGNICHVIPTDRLQLNHK
ncbi:DNA-binding transcriptional regulator, MerR family [Ferrithrix thermotolerans DSM 19514]|jgi:DNA-binding transcriptional MerR regulator|uniref:DNA-binding transcriptional regulator, MerR family n=1 Tax=Ferrithrix thermotolerans DSM 19514 TaxID=1121881 RepID=A0A1M4XC46_9ACTN|nr:MerR family transcriptional regulator [Ferrithrix thermotolerans]SHE91104.1 DNA-binding transcriptional regulator, MerR family [Ferrithrix thermotolerans DSM 19514]